jgi:hypothetical protein
VDCPLADAFVIYAMMVRLVPIAHAEDVVDLAIDAGETSSKRTAAADSSQTSHDGHIVDPSDG